MRTLSFLGIMLFAMPMFAGEKTSEQKAAEFLNKNKVAVCASMMDKEPYLSVMPVAFDHGKPLVFISDLAQHTDNLNASPKASLVIYQVDPDDIFNATRATFQGEMIKIKDEKEIERLSQLYVTKFPDAKILLDFADFHFYRMEVKDIHWIGGFGDIDWPNVQKYLEEAKKE